MDFAFLSNFLNVGNNFAVSITDLTYLLLKTLVMLNLVILLFSTPMMTSATLTQKDRDAAHPGTCAKRPVSDL